jgi:hypothetical protein
MKVPEGLLFKLLDLLSGRTLDERASDARMASSAPDRTRRNTITRKTTGISDREREIEPRFLMSNWM